MKEQKNKGFTLIEMIVTFALLAIVGSFMGAAYFQTMEDQRMKKDLAILENIDNSLKNTLIREDSFKELKLYIHDKNKLDITFPIQQNGRKGEAILSQAYVGGEGNTLAMACPKTFKYLVSEVGEDVIKLDSNSLIKGKYVVNLSFNGAKVSAIRDYTPTNDSIKVSNSGKEFIEGHK